MGYTARFREGDLRTNFEVNGTRYNIYTDAFGNARQMRTVDGKPVGDPVLDDMLAEHIKSAGFKGWVVSKTDDEALTKVEGVEGYDPELDPSHPDYVRPLSQAELMQIEVRYALEAQRGGPGVAIVSPRAMLSAPMPESDLATANASLSAENAALQETVKGLQLQIEEMTDFITNFAKEKHEQSVGAGQVTVNPSPIQESDPSAPETAAPTAASMGKDNRTPQEKAAATRAAKKAKGGEADEADTKQAAALGGIKVEE